MHLVTAVLAFATTALAHPPWYGSGSGSGWSRPPQYPNTCLNATGIDALVAGYTYLLQSPGGADFNATADAILSETAFVVQSDSIRTLSGLPLGEPAYPSKAAFVDTQFQTPPLPVVETLGVFADCDQISWRWNASGVGSNAFPVRGMIVFEVDLVKVQITTVYSEFNTAAFESDLGA